MMEKGYTYRYPRPMLTVDAVVFTREPKPRMLLVRRRNKPFVNQWALPGGFVEMDETLDTAVARELREETGLAGVPLTQFHTFGDPGRDPRGRTVSIAYVGVVGAAAPLQQGDDAAEAAWQPVDALPELAFDHADIVRMALEWVQKEDGLCR